MRRYLSQIPREEAARIIREHFSQPESPVRIPVTNAVGRVAAIPVFSPESLPSSRIASMDGIAVHSADTKTARDRTPCEPVDFFRINTGQQVPDEYDAIIPSEETGESESGKIQIRKPARPGQNIREPGEEIRKGRLIFPAGHRIIPADIGALLTYGITDISVRSLNITLIPTGDELVRRTAIPQPGQVRESNTAMIVAMLSQAGISPVCHDIVPDDPIRLRQVIISALETSDMIIISAGSSAGSRDHTREVITELGTILFHGVAIRPGKSLLCGEVLGKPVIGLPGQPVASLTAFREVILPLLEEWGFRYPHVPLCTARVAEPVPSDGGIDEYVPVSVIRVNGETIILPRPRGPGGQMHGIRSNAILHIPAQKEGYPQGAVVSVRLTRELDETRLPVLLCGPGGSLTDSLEAACGDAAVSLVIRQMSGIGAAASLCNGNCHAIIVDGDRDNRDNEVFNLLKSACPDHLNIVSLGSISQGICTRQELSHADIPALRTICHETGTDPLTLCNGEPDPGNTPIIIPECFRVAETEEQVISAVVSGEADAGLCSWQTAVNAGLFFLPVKTESWHLVFREKSEIRDEIIHFIRFLASDTWRQTQPPFSGEKPGERVCCISPEGVWSGVHAGRDKERSGEIQS